MTDAIIGATYYDKVHAMEFEVVGIYERHVRDDTGGMIDTEVVVDASYENVDEPVRIGLESFKTDPCIEIVEKPDHAR